MTDILDFRPWFIRLCSIRQHLWNKLPKHFRSDNNTGRGLKTVLFARAYSSAAPLRTVVYKWTYLHVVIYLLTLRTVVTGR